MLDDASVLAKYGDEAFRRRDELLTTRARVAYPERAELIGRRVVSALRDAGWTIEVDETLAFRATQGEAELDVRGRVHSLTVTAAGGVHVLESVGVAEHMLLRAMQREGGMSVVDDIMSWKMIEVSP